MAGEVADGVHVHPLNHPMYLRETVIPNLREGAHRAGRSAEDLEIIVPAFIVPVDDDEARWRNFAQCRSRSTDRRPTIRSSSSSWVSRAPRTAFSSANAPAIWRAWPPRCPTNCSTISWSRACATNSPTGSWSVTTSLRRGSSAARGPRLDARPMSVACVGRCRSSSHQPMTTPRYGQLSYPLYYRLAGGQPTKAIDFTSLRPRRRDRRGSNGAGHDGKRMDRRHRCAPPSNGCGAPRSSRMGAPARRPHHGRAR